MHVDARVAEVAGRQHGVVAHAQAIGAGLSPRQIAVRLRLGTWQTVHRGVYRIAGSLSTREQRLAAATLACGEGAVVSHRAAGELWSLNGVEPGWTEVTVAQSHLPRHHGVTVHRTKDLLPRHVARRHDLRVTNPMRTLVDLGLVVPRPVVQRAMDDALGRKLVSVAGLVRIWRDVARPGRNGSGVLRSLLEEHLPVPHATRLEKAMLRLHRRYGLPEPEVEYSIHDEAGRFVGRADFVHVEARLVIEVDGYEKRTSLDAFQRDRSRDRKLRALGWTVLRFTWLEVIHTPKDVAAEIAAFLARTTVSVSS